MQGVPDFVNKCAQNRPAKKLDLSSDHFSIKLNYWYSDMQQTFILFTERRDRAFWISFEAYCLTVD